MFYYEGLVREMIREAKYGRRARILPYFAQRLSILARTEFSSVQALVPVPLHRSREWERTFNQALLVAQEISKLTRIPVWPVLSKIKKTLPQSSLSGAARRAYLKNAYRFDGNGSIYGTVLLVDDVMTTGATLRECAAVLRRAGVSRVDALTIARSVKERSGHNL
jgi:ComF family protein